MVGVTSGSLTRDQAFLSGKARKSANGEREFEEGPVWSQVIGGQKIFGNHLILERVMGFNQRPIISFRLYKEVVGLSENLGGATQNKENRNKGMLKDQSLFPFLWGGGQRVGGFGGYPLDFKKS